MDAVSEASAGDLLKMTVYRSGSTVEIEVTVGEKVQSALANEQTEQNEQYQQNQQGESQYGYGYGNGYGIPGFGGGFGGFGG